MLDKKVIILGGGIRGLSIAHQLVKNGESKIKNITVIEKNNYLGGQYAEDNNIIINNRYTDLLNILEEIGIKSNLRNLSIFMYAIKDKYHVEYDTSFLTNGLGSFIKGYEMIYDQKISFKDKLQLYKLYYYIKFLPDKRLKDFDKITWSDYTSNLSPNIRRLIVESIGVLLGMDCDKISTYFIFKIIRQYFIKSKSKDKDLTFYIFNGLLKDVLYDPWKKYLESHGIKFLLNSTITKIYHNPGFITISSIDVMCSITKETKVHTAYKFFNTMDLKNLSKLYPVGKDSENKLNYVNLFEQSKYVRLQLTYHIPYKFKMEFIDPAMLIIIDSKWFLSFRIDYNNDVDKDYQNLQCIIGNNNVMGLNKKYAINCTKEELAEECWNQLMLCKHQLELKNKDIPNWTMSDKYRYNIITMQLEISSPYFSENINTLDIRPKYKDTLINNLFNYY
jgi:hypothetical protein